MGSVSNTRRGRNETRRRRPGFGLAAAHWRRWGVLCAVLVGTAGCAAPPLADASGPEAPHITQLSITPAHVAYGCPVTLQFRFADPHGDLMRVHAAWRVSRPTRGVGSRVLTLPVDAATLAGQTSGEVQVPLHLEQYGTTVWYDVQVEDAGGRKSNVLSTAVLMDGPVPWASQPSRCG